MGRLNDWIRDADGLGYGETVGRRIRDSDFPHSDPSILSAAYRCGVPAVADETKNKSARTIPMAPALIAALAVQRAQPPGAELVFAGADRHPIRQFNKQWNAACERAGLDGMLFHDLRRIGVRNLNRAGVSQHVAMQISGHKTASVFCRYDIVDETDLLDAAQKLQRHVDARHAATQEATKSCNRVAPTVQ